MGRNSLPFAVVAFIAGSVVLLAWRWNGAVASWPTTRDAFVRSEGAPAGAGGTRQSLWVTASFERAQAAQIHLGDRAEMKVPATRDVTWTGYVEALLGERSARRIPVKIVFDPWLQTHRLQPGMPVVATVKTEP